MNHFAALPALDALFHWTLTNSWRATALIAVVMLLRWALGKRLAPKFKYALGFLILFRLALPAEPASPISLFNLGKVAGVAEPANPVAIETGTPPTAPSPMKIGPAAAPSMSVPVAGVEKREPPVEEISRNVVREPDWMLLGEMLWIAGVVAMLARAACQQWRMVFATRGLEPVREKEVCAMLEEVKGSLGIRREVRLLVMPGLKTPALFGHWRPRILLPPGMIERLPGSELRLVLLHELTHLLRWDILVNWVRILLRAWHWFNPAVWQAMWQLRADQELACDASVLARLRPAEQRLYGDTLLKLVEEYSCASFSPGLTLFTTTPNLTKRRIDMITNFKPSSLAARLGVAALIFALFAITFTRAANPTAPQAVAPPGAADVSPEQNDRLAEALKQIEKLRAELAALRKQSGTESERGDEARRKADVDVKRQREEQIRMIDVLQRQKAVAAEEVRDMQTELDKLRVDFAIPSSVAERNGYPGMDSETMRHYMSVQAESDSQYYRQQALLKSLKNLDRDQIQQALLTAAPDQILTSLEQQLLSAQTSLIALKTNMAGTHPQVQAAQAMVDALKAQVDARVKGILAGMEATSESLKQVSVHVDETLKTLKKTDIDTALSYRPYFELKHKLELKRKNLDELTEQVEQQNLRMNLDSVQQH